ncbi:beta-galactosidase BgaS [Thermococcus sp.]|uniref:beta-galactosidase BgaS n=1 Tax=Thermococcus sp. TaxID=35749 RepID=UPI0026258813|nr:beta-galactosidase BgaS [Thermococcus sp.]
MLPEDFLWGVSQSGFQFEMGDKLRRNIDPNTDWWKWVRDPFNIKRELVSGDLPEEGINNYELYVKDHLLAKDLGLNAYRIGIEWSRIFPWPTWFVDVEVERDSYGLVKDVKINKNTLEELDEIANRQEVAYYRRVIEHLREMGFKVIVNLNHFTLPLWLHDPILAREKALTNGRIGWVGQESVVEFAKYAAYIANALGDLVDMWSTFNEPMVVVELGYLAPYSGFPPGVMNPEAAKLAILNMINAHALAYKMIKKFDRVKADKDSRSEAEVGIIYNNIGVAYPHDPNDPKDLKAAENDNYFHSGLFFDAIHEGKLNIEFDGETFVKAKHLKGNDWIGVNYYTREVVRYSEPKFPSIPLITFRGVHDHGYACRPGSSSADGRPVSDIGWEIYPEGIYDSIKEANRYGVPVYVTENGIADSTDALRPYYIASHVAKIEEAHEAGYDVRGYLYWALTDNYEWALGFRMRFGLYKVDLITKERTPREESVKVYRSIVENNGVSRELREKFGLG